jgi:hypothetical protein
MWRSALSEVEGEVLASSSCVGGSQREGGKGRDESSLPTTTSSFVGEGKVKVVEKEMSHHHHHHYHVSEEVEPLSHVE